MSCRDCGEYVAHSQPVNRTKVPRVGILSFYFGRD